MTYVAPNRYPNDTQTSTKVGGSSVAFSFSGSNLWIYGAPEGNIRNYAVSVDSVDQKLDENYETDVIYNQESIEGLYDIVLNSTNDSDLVFDSVSFLYFMCALLLNLLQGNVATSIRMR